MELLWAWHAQQPVTYCDLQVHYNHISRSARQGAFVRMLPAVAGRNGQARRERDQGEPCTYAQADAVAQRAATVGFDDASRHTYAPIRAKDL